MNRKQRTLLSGLVVVSMLFCLLAAAIQAGYEHPIRSVDSKGNQLGFNNPLTLELYGILFKSASLADVARLLGWYGFAYLLFHLMALIIFVRDLAAKHSRAVSSFFLFQLFIFPVGYVGMLIAPGVICDFFTGKLDGEDITDFPFALWCAFQAVWIIISGLSLVFIWKNGKKSLPADIARSPLPDLGPS